MGPCEILAGTTGEIIGRVLNQKGEPLAGATVMVVGTKLGAYTGTDGSYNVLNISPGTYDVQISHITSDALLTRGLVVSADNATRLDVTLRDRSVVMKNPVRN